MNIERLNSLYKEISELNNTQKLNLKICASYGIYLNSNFLKLNVQGDKLFSGNDNIFYSNYRAPRDIDFIAPLSKKQQIEKALLNNQFEINKELSLIPGIKRHIFYRNDVKIDVFYNEFDFNHRIDLMKKSNSINKIYRIDIYNETIPVSELLLQKLQIVNIGEKDLIGAWWLFKEYKIQTEYNDKGINMPLVNEYLSNDWGFYHTVTSNINKLLSLYGNDSDVTFNKIVEFQKIIENSAKSIRWRIRKNIGTKIKWYNEVENI